MAPMTGLETVAVKAIPKVIPPATRAVRKLLDNHHDRKAMAKILEDAMLRAAKTVFPPRDVPSVSDVVRVTQGAMKVGQTGSAQPANWFVAAMRRWPRFLGGHRPRELQTVGPQAAIAELALWIRMGALAENVELLKDENYALTAAELFIEEILTPRPVADNADFRNRLTKAWLTQAEDASAAARLRRWIEYPVLLTAAAAAAGAIFGLSGEEVLQIAAAAGASSAAVTGGVAIYHRDRDPDTKPKSEAEFVELLNLLEQVSAFVVDLVRVSFTEESTSLPATSPMDLSAPAAPACDADPELPKLLIVLIDDLDNRLIPAADQRAPLLAAHLKRVSDQLRLLQQRRPAFDPLILHSAVGNLWQALERVGYKNRTQIPSPFELPKERDMPLALPPAAAAAPLPRLRRSPIGRPRT